MVGALITWARKLCAAEVGDAHEYRDAVDETFELLRTRCGTVQQAADLAPSLTEMERLRDQLLRKWERNPQKWEEFPAPAEEYFLLWLGQLASRAQKENGVAVPSSMRQVDGSAELAITQGYAILTSSTTH